MPERLSKPEFVALMAMMFATIAFSIDAMLPAMPEIARELTPDAPNRAQLILTSFVLGMGIGTLFTGPLSDAYGRKPVIIAGSALYVAGAVAAWFANSLELMLVARVAQGIGVAGPRIVALAIIRDLYEGRVMAQLMSFVMMVFTLVPAIAPTIGAGIIWAADWRAIFLAFILFSAISTIWLTLRQRETHPVDRRRPMRLRLLLGGLAEVFGNRMVSLIVVALTLTFGALFGLLSSIQPIFDVTFGEAAHFHWWFMLIAVVSASGSLLNSRIVLAIGMRRVASQSFLFQTVASALMVLVSLRFGWSGDWALYLFVAWASSVFFIIGLTIGNLNALAMVPLGHMAGLAASILGGVSTIAAIVVAVNIGLAFDGTPLPAIVGVGVCCFLAYMIMRTLPQPQQAADGAQ